MNKEEAVASEKKGSGYNERKWAEVTSNEDEAKKEREKEKIMQDKQATQI